jgi:hypothetical protein
MVEPGEYVVRITVGDHAATKTVIVDEDPRVRITLADRRVRQSALMRSYEIQTGALRLERAMLSLQGSIEKPMQTTDPTRPAPIVLKIRTAARQFEAKVREHHRSLTGIAQRAERVLAEVEAFTVVPNERQHRELRDLGRAYETQSRAARQLAVKDLPEMNKMLRGAGLERIATPAELQ